MFIEITLPARYKSDSQCDITKQLLAIHSIYGSHHCRIDYGDRVEWIVRCPSSECAYQVRYMFESDVIFYTLDDDIGALVQQQNDKIDRQITEDIFESWREY